MTPSHSGRQFISRRLGLAVVTALVLARSIPILVWSDLYFDADQAVMGLMARHIAEGRATPVFQYGVPYVLVLEAWLTAPLMWLSDSSVLLVKAVPVALNVITVGLLYWMLTTAALAPQWALLAVAPVAFAGAAAAHELSAALGMSIEPLLFTLLLWLLRERPVALGLMAAVAIKNREFALYAIAALGAVDLLRKRSAALWRPRLAGVVAFAVAWTTIGLLARQGSPFGPGSSAAMMDGDNVAVAAAAVCVAPDRIPSDVAMVTSELLPFLYGVRSTRWDAAGHPGPPPPDASWLWIPMAGALAAGAASGLWRARRGRPTEATWLAVYLLITGALAVAVYAATRCGNASFFTVRYLLLSLYVPVAALVLGFDQPRRSPIQAVLAGLTVVWLGVLAAGQVTVLREYLAAPPVSAYRQLARHLEQRGVEYILTDYWIGYHVAFLTGERVRPLTNFSRILEYSLAVEAHRDRATRITRITETPCENAVVVAAFYVCTPVPAAEP